jgi:hypothetical protein
MDSRSTDMSTSGESMSGSRASRADRN